MGGLFFFAGYDVVAESGYSTSLDLTSCQKWFRYHDGSITTCSVLHKRPFIPQKGTE